MHILALALLAALTIINPDGTKYTVDGDLIFNPLATPTPTPTPTVTPTPTPAPTPAPGFTMAGVTVTYPVPEPEPFTPPPFIRKVRVTNSAELLAASRAAVPGDCIVLAAGAYDAVYELRASGTPDKRIIFLGEPGATLGSVWLDKAAVAYVSFIGLTIIPTTPANGAVNIKVGSHHIDVIACQIKPSTKAAGGVGGSGIYITNQDQGGFNFLNNKMEWQGAMTPGAWGAEGIAGIEFQAGRMVGNDVLIAGNVISRFHDAITLGEGLGEGLSRNVTVRGNFAYDCGDDFFQCDGNIDNLIIENNVLGGTAYGAIAAISLAPMGGKTIVRNNHIGGFLNLPVKANSDQPHAAAMSLEVTGNTIVQPLVAGSQIGWYWPMPSQNLHNVTITDNRFLSRGAVYVTESFSIPGLTLDRNRLWSTGEMKWNNSPNLFRFWDGSRNVYMNTLDELRTKFGFEKSGIYGPLNLQAVAIPGYTTDKLCRWRIVQ